MHTTSFVRHTKLQKFCMLDKAGDGRNVALNCQVFSWCSRSTKEESRLTTIESYVATGCSSPQCYLNTDYWMVGTHHSPAQQQHVIDPVRPNELRR